MPFTVTCPKLSPTMEEGIITKWRKKEGEYVNAGDTLLEITTDKATVEHTALDEGFLRKILIPEGKSAKVNQAIAIFTEKQDESLEGYQVESPKEEIKQEEPSVSAATSAAPMRKEMLFTPAAPIVGYQFEESEELLASPLAKKIAQEKGLDLSSVKGTGPHGRVTSDDLEFALPETLVSFKRKGRPTTTPGTYEEIPLSPMRMAIGNRLQACKSQIPHFYLSQKINATPLYNFREELKKLRFEKITFNDMIIRASAIALRKHTNLNSGYDNSTDQIIQFKTIDISVAVTIEGGLTTPIIRHADYKNLGEISSEMKRLSERAKHNQLKEEEYRGGSFTISNLGMFGITEFIAVINPPQAAILAVGGIQDEPVIKEGSVVPGKTLTLTLSCDHRVIDGTDAAGFLRTLKEILESPLVALTLA